jgi:DNA topoisomerase-1
LVIVESPGKIKKLESILGSGYLVTSSFGHIMDLPRNALGIDIDNKFNPIYQVITGNEKFQDKKKVVKDLLSKASRASKVIIAADDDREGEMIGWCYKEALKLNENEYERITFNSITKEEVKRAISTPGKINMLMVESQKTRRILDRLVGFKISPCLSQIMGMRGLSAGRVQSVVVKLICDKEQEINKFFEGSNASYFKFNGVFILDNPVLELKCELVNDNNTESKNDTKNSDNEHISNTLKIVKLTTYKEAYKLMKQMSKSTFKISDIDIRHTTRNPSPPFTTSTVQQEASTKLGFSVKKTMVSLQKLYESGYTTYLRTDSTNLSKDAMKQCFKYIKSTYGKKYYRETNYTNKKGNTQEAHEAIRPVKITTTSVILGGKLGPDEQKVYELVWRRTVASQMQPSKIDVYSIDISISKEQHYYFRTKIEDITFPGYLLAYGIGVHGQNINDMVEDYKVLLPKVNQKVEAKNIKCSEEYNRPPLRYSEAGLVKKMDPKNLNIGRPATYAEIINTVQKRKYVEIKNITGISKQSRQLIWHPSTEIQLDKKTIYIGKENKKFCPTELGIQINDIMLRNFPELMDYKFTSSMEKQLDRIAEGKLNWVNCLQSFWNTLEPLLKTLNEEKKIERILGNNPKTGYEVIASIGMYGPMLTMARSSKKSENAIAPIGKPYNLDTITLEEALKILKYPKILGVHKRKNVELKKGKHGFYITHGKNSSNISDDINPDDITLQTAIDLINTKIKKKQSKIDSYIFYKKEGDIEYIVNTGNYGEDNRYVMVRNINKKNIKPIFVSLPKNILSGDITLEYIKELVSNRYHKKTKSSKKVKIVSKKTK